MRMTLASLSMNAAILTVLGLPSVAAAQDAAPAGAPSDATATTTTAAPAAAPVAVAPAAPPPAPLEAAPAAAPEAPADKPVPSYFRLDHDYMFGLQLWAGATYPLTDTIGLATDIYVAENFVSASESGAAQSWWGEFDIGPAFTLGPVTLTPMAGIAFDWFAKRAVALNVPQLYTVLNLDKVYFESWVWTVLYSPFKDQVFNDYFHTRNWLLYKATGTISVGPQFEFMYLMDNKVAKKGVAAMPLGGHVELAFGTGNSLGLFLGYELDKDVRDSVGGKGAVGRLTFVHNF